MVYLNEQRGYPVHYRVIKNGYEENENKVNDIEKSLLSSVSNLDESLFRKGFHRLINSYLLFILQIRALNSANKVEDNAVMMADISRMYEKRWFEAEKEKLRIEEKIDQVKEPHRTLLHKRYIEELNFEKIADEMNYSYVRVTHLHGEALLEYEKLTSRDKT